MLQARFSAVNGMREVQRRHRRFGSAKIDIEGCNGWRTGECESGPLEVAASEREAAIDIHVNRAPAITFVDEKWYNLSGKKMVLVVVDVEIN